MEAKAESDDLCFRMMLEPGDLQLVHNHGESAIVSSLPCPSPPAPLSRLPLPPLAPSHPKSQTPIDRSTDVPPFSLTLSLSRQ